MIKRLLQYGMIAAVNLSILYLLVTFLQIEQIDFRMLYFIVFSILFILYLKHAKMKVFILDSFSQNPIFSKVLLVLLLILLPFMLKENAYMIHICVMIELYVIMALGLNIYLGSFGLLNFCFGAFFGIGAYASVLLGSHFHLSFWITLVLGGLGGLLGGILISLFTLKSKGFYYVLVTFAFQQVFHLLINNMDWTGGPNGQTNIPYPTLGGYSLGESLNLFGTSLPFNVNFYYLTLVICILAILVCVRINASQTALIWNAVREDEIAANCQGINILWRKVEVGAVGAFFGALAGPIYAHYVNYISPEVFTWEVPIVLLSMIVLGGLNSIPGIILGVTILTVLPEKFQLISNYRTFIYGLIILFSLFFKPGGFIPEKVREYRNILAR
jgi:ABC-type branched-subunit amino acid transport system permease subunit